MSILQFIEFAFIVGATLWLARAFVSKLVADVQAHVTQKYPFEKNKLDSLGWVIEDWQWEGLPALSSQLGAIAFLVYSYRMEAHKGRTAFEIADAEPINNQLTLSASEHYIKYNKKLKMQPNIVVMQCESLFNPEAAFEIDGKLNSRLFLEQKYTFYNGLMRVNIVGGGSWISEFEFLTGLDTRAFGYLGYYSHVTLSPYIKMGFPCYLRSRGYQTSAYYPTDGNFYNSERAYYRYGFEDFLDPSRLGIDDDWAPADIEMANAFIERSRGRADKPTFSFIVTNGAHGPYDAEPIYQNKRWACRFSQDSEKHLNSELNEYLRRIVETEDAVMSVVARLHEIEAETGRPFVLAFYGDHQPFPFTGDMWYDRHIYDHVRTNISKQSTWFHILSSTSNLSLEMPQEIPLTLLPSILSAFAVNDHSEIYMAQNFAVYRTSGSVMFPDLAAPTNIHLQENGELFDRNYSSFKGSSISHEAYIASARVNGLLKF